MIVVADCLIHMAARTLMGCRDTTAKSTSRGGGSEFVFVVLALPAIGAAMQGEEYETVHINSPMLRNTCIIVRNHYSQISSNEGAVSSRKLDLSWANVGHHGPFLTTDYNIWFPETNNNLSAAT